MWGLSKTRSIVTTRPSQDVKYTAWNKKYQIKSISVILNSKICEPMARGKTLSLFDLLLAYALYYDSLKNVKILHMTKSMHPRVHTQTWNKHDRKATTNPFQSTRAIYMTTINQQHEHHHKSHNNHLLHHHDSVAWFMDIPHKTAFYWTSGSQTFSASKNPFSPYKPPLILSAEPVSVVH